MNNSIAVLVVEDEEIWANEIQIMLGELGFTVAAVVSCVEDALTAIRTVDFDIVLLDIHLNGKNSGLEIGKLLYTTYYKPYIFITGSSDGHSLAEAVTCNPSAYLIKPANKASLFVTIQSAIHNFNHQQTPQNINQNAEPTLSHFFIKQGNGFKKMEWQQVTHLIAEKNYVRALMVNDNHGYLFRSSLQNTIAHIIPKNMQPTFLQINRSEIVNISVVEALHSNQLVTSVGKFLISDNFLEAVKKQLHILV